MGKKLKRFFEDIIFYVKSVFSNRQRVKGHCKACGLCCKTIVFYVGENLVKTEEQFELLKKWDKKSDSCLEKHIIKLYRIIIIKHVDKCI